MNETRITIDSRPKKKGDGTWKLMIIAFAVSAGGMAALELLLKYGVVR